MASLIVLVGGGTWSAGGTEPQGDIRPALGVLTNLVQLDRAVSQTIRTNCNLRLEGIVCTVNPDRSWLVLQDDSGAELVGLERGCQPVMPGQRVVLTGNDCEVSRRSYAFGISRRPVVDNDGLHPMMEKSGTMHLEAGRHPIRLVWFNKGQDFGLEVSYAGPGTDRRNIPASALFRAPATASEPAGSATLLNGLNYRCYQGYWNSVPDFSRLTQVSSGSATNFDLGLRSRDQFVGLEFTGYFEASQEGLYTFWTRSDDGSRLFLGEPMPRVEVVGAGAVPVARPLDLDRPLSDGTGGQWSEAEGKVTFVAEREHGLELELADGLLRVLVAHADNLPGAMLLNSSVRLKGVCHNTIALDGRKRPGLLLAASGNEVELLEAAPELWANCPLMKISEAAQPRSQPGGAMPVRASGQVVSTGPGQFVVADQSGQITVESPQEPSPGSSVEVLGIWEHGPTNMVLAHGCWRPLGRDTRERKVVLPLLTAVEQVHRLKSREAVRGYPVRLRGVVTCDDTGFLFMQDTTRGVFVSMGGAVYPDPPRVGEEWKIEGVTGRGDFAPIVTASNLTRIGIGHFPTPVRPSWHQLINGSLDAQFVEIEGVVTAVTNDTLTLLMHGGQMRVQFTGGDRQDLAHYLSAVIRIRGALRASWVIATGEVRIGEIGIGSPAIEVDQPVPPDLFAVPLKTVQELLLFDPAASSFQRVRVSGQLIGMREEEFYVMSGAQGLRFLRGGLQGLHTGDSVEVVGFPELTGASPLLREAAVRIVGHASLPMPAEITSEDMFQPRYDSTRVRLQALLVSLRDEPAEQVLELLSGMYRFRARLNNRYGHLPALEPHSSLELTGVYVGQHGSRASSSVINSFELLIGSSADVRLLAHPPWLTLRRLLMIVGALMAILVIALVWITQLRRRVEERTVQLAGQIVERERAEHRAAVEAERSRIARDLHDDLGSSLTEISLLGNIGLAGPVGEASRTDCISQIIKKAGESVSALDVIVWAVNPKENSLQSLADYLSGFASDFLAASALTCRIQMPVRFPAITLDGRTRHDIFLAVKEALNNVVRHAHATEAEVGMILAENCLRVSIADNGRGFDPVTRSAGNGLANLEARLARLGGCCMIEAHSGTGTRVTLSLSLPVGTVGEERPMAESNTPFSV